LVADLVRNKSVEQAQDMLHYNGNRASHIIGRLLNSAVANAAELDANEAWHEGAELDSDALFVKRIVVDEGDDDEADQTAGAWDGLSHIAPALPHHARGGRSVVRRVNREGRRA